MKLPLLGVTATKRRVVAPGRLMMLVGVLALASTTWACPGAAQASSGPSALSCGQVLIHSVRLSRDLIDCAHTGLVVGAANVTVDLAGHTISGRNAPNSEGIADEGHRGVVIKGGVIRGFFRNGVGLRDAPYSTVRDLDIRGIGAGGTENQTSAGVQLDHSPHSTVHDSSISNQVSAWQSDGVDVTYSPGTTIRDNTMANNAWDGIFVLASPASRIASNSFNGNQNQGAEINADSDHVAIEGNRAHANLQDGIVVGALTDAVIVGNTFVGNGDTGLFMFDLQHSLISHNWASGNSVGINLDGGQHGSRRNRIIANNTSLNHELGLTLGDAADANLVSANVANNNQGAPGQGGGIIVFASRNNDLRTNIANRNQDVGIGVFENSPGDAASNRLTANTANRNHAHGIDTVQGTLDDGHNTAHHNTPLPDCLGVVCS
jgi:parallel beta-helix repeat protein